MFHPAGEASDPDDIEDAAGGGRLGRAVGPLQVSWHQMLPLIDAIEARLTAIENLLGIATEATDELRRTDERIAELRHEKETAIEAQDFTKAAALRDQERELLRIQGRLRKEVPHRQPADADEESESS